ncbi:MAG TPA: hypothetical protein VGB83_04590 [Actinomycetota bacterium]
MQWTLIVSEDDGFQRRALACMPDRSYVVGATGDGSARQIVGALNVATVLVDARDDAGRKFLGSLAGLPSSRLPRILAVGLARASTRFERHGTVTSAVRAGLAGAA